MKTLIIGIDGGDDRIFSGFEMPFYQKLKESLVTLSVVEDLWSRGWAEMLTGKHGSETGAFYQKPTLDGSHAFTQSFGLRDIRKNKQITPIWELLNDRGYTVGLMNIPTTGPAPVLDGFLVSGAGGGAGALTGIPEDSCYPNCIAKDLEELDYILDTRFVYSGIKDEELFFERLIKMQERRTEAFIRLVEKHKVDFGFVALMATTRLQYLGMSEIESFLSMNGMSELSIRGSNLSSFQHRLLLAYRSLDACIERLVNELNPDSLMLVADHGASPYKYKANIESFLVETGMLVKSKNASVYDLGARVSSNRISEGIRRRVGRVFPTLSELKDWRKTYAFGNRYISGAYVNDKRFGGIVSDAEVSHIVKCLCDEFNSSLEACQFEMQAFPYREQFERSDYSDFLPDVWIDKPDCIFFEGDGDFIAENPSYGPVYDLNLVDRDVHSGIKGRHPICMASGELTDVLTSDDAMNLTTIYKMVERSFKG